ncbi:Uncharacterized protein PECH_005704 [Penicillium ucsense]|uniref:GIT Spa2 homology (SHD) domain-containing protein n=1 Tax=Penicillium ucsense TaxID=2839758 RepID=A0A8J8VYT5_9EURO|nr:Uncharacterized protein PECM_001304 [Penicillium ucsense]KAF7736222.1 Uncharacterized protein PECH_005704 [Penicillium ucsense]
MNGPAGGLSPISVDGSDWSGLNQYQKTDAPFSPTISARGTLATPPTSGAPSSPLSPNSGGPPSNGNPSPPSSVAARSSIGTINSEKGGRRGRPLEDVMHQHYVTLKRFLDASLREERKNGRSEKARDKLLRLSATQFHELSTDVYDELVRRQQAMPPPGRPARTDVPSFLPPRKDFHEKRNHARRKLASLQHARFRDLATDVFCELERRFPHFTGRPRPPPPGSRSSQSRGPPPAGRGYPSGGPPGGPFPPRQVSLGAPPVGPNGEGPVPRAFQSSTMVPNKSTMVEDSDDMAGDDDEDARSDAFALDAVLSRRGTTTTLGDSERKLLMDSQTQVSALQEKVEKLEEQLRMKDDEIARGSSADQSMISQSERQEWDDLRQDLERKVSKAEDLNHSLQEELEKMRAEHDRTERDLRSQLEEVSLNAGDPELEARYTELETKHQSLQAELQQQQQVAAEVRRVASESLAEMRSLTTQNHKELEREERLSVDVHRLENEVNEWKDRYAKAKSQLRDLRSSAGSLADQIPDASKVVAREHELLQPDGVVEDLHVTKFQISIDELLRVARIDDPHQVSRYIKNVIVAVRRIIHDVDQAPPMDGSAALRVKAKGRVSVTANNMITAARNFARSAGLSPVSLMDAAASHLSTAVVELIRIVKIRVSSVDASDEEEEQDLSTDKSPEYFSVPPSQRRLSNNSEYSVLSPPDEMSSSLQQDVSTTQSYNYGAPQGDHELQELKLYVEDQTDSMVQSIQALVASIRAEHGMDTVEIYVSAIGNIVGNVIASTEHLMHDRSGDVSLREQSQPVIHSLSQCRDRLTKTVTEGHNATGPEQLRELTNQLPPLAFETARHAKDLIQRLETLSLGDDDDDDFR